MNPPVVLCGNLIIGVHGPFLSLKTEKVPVNHFDSPTLFTIEPFFVGAQLFIAYLFSLLDINAT